MTSPRIAIAHDYLVQVGGAERVVATWTHLFPDAPIYTMAYAPDRTFPDFRDRRIHLPRFGVSPTFAHSVDAFLPVLPLVAASFDVAEPVDWVLASTSGFAHGFRTDAPLVAYCHSPARWLYETADYSAGLGLTRRAGLRVLSGYLRRADRAAARRVSTYVANSAVTRDRIRRAYRIDAPIVHPPVQRRVPPDVGSGLSLPDGFALCVARVRGYKNLTLAVEATRAAGIPLVVVGTGTERLGSDEPHVTGLGRVSDGELSALYAEAAVLLGVAHEDFGLTPVEAAQAGTPTVAIDRGGYRETVEQGVNGLLVAETVQDVAEGLGVAVNHSWDIAAIRASADRFTPEAHVAGLLGAVHDMASA